MYIKRCSIITFLIFLIGQSYAQQSKDLVGTWKVSKVGLLPNAQPEEKQVLEKLTQIMLKSTFHFKEDHSFSFDSPEKDLVIKTGVWQFDEDKKFIEITERLSKGVTGQLMGISVKVLNNEYLFWLEESPVILKVIKVEG